MIHHKKKKNTHLRPNLSMSHIAIRMHGSMSKHVTPFAKMDADSQSISMLASKPAVPNCIKIWRVKYRIVRFRIETYVAKDSNLENIHRLLMNYSRSHWRREREQQKWWDACAPGKYEMCFRRGVCDASRQLSNTTSFRDCKTRSIYVK